MKTKFRRLGLEKLEDRNVPSTIAWTDGNADHAWNEGGNWQGGVVPSTTNDIAYFGDDLGSDDYCDCSLTGQVAKGISMSIYYQGTTSRLHFTASGSSTVIVGASGVQMDGGGIEQDNGCTLELAGDSTFTGGELNAESSALGTLSVDAAKASSWEDTQNLKSGDSLVVHGTQTINMSSDGTDQGSVKSVLLSKGAGIQVGHDGVLNWNHGNILKDTGATVGSFTNYGDIEYSAHGGHAWTDKCDLPFIQDNGGSGAGSPVFETHSYATPSTDVYSEIDWQGTSGSGYSVDIKSGYVYLSGTKYTSGTGTARSANYWKLVNSSMVVETSLVTGHGEVVTTGTATSKASGKDITFNGGELYLGSDSGLYLVDNNLKIEGGAILDVDIHGNTSGSNGQLIAATGASIIIDDATGSVEAINADGGQVAGTWTFFSGTVTLTNDFDTWVDLSGGGAGHGHWYFSYS